MVNSPRLHLRMKTNARRSHSGFLFKSIATGVLITFTTLQVAWAQGPPPTAGEIEKPFSPKPE